MPRTEPVETACRTMILFSSEVRVDAVGRSSLWRRLD